MNYALMQSKEVAGSSTNSKLTLRCLWMGKEEKRPIGKRSNGG